MKNKLGGRSSSPGVGIKSNSPKSKKSRKTDQSIEEVNIELVASAVKDRADDDNDKVSLDELKKKKLDRKKNPDDQIEIERDWSQSGINQFID